jgi:hypothetical protein
LEIYKKKKRVESIFSPYTVFKQYTATQILDSFIVRVVHSKRRHITATVALDLHFRLLQAMPIPARHQSKTLHVRCRRLKKD